MKKIGFITRNKLLAQSLAFLIKSNPDLPFEPFVLRNLSQAATDAEVLGINVAVIESFAGSSTEAEKVLALCADLRQASPDCQILLLVPQDYKEGRDLAMRAVKSGFLDDYVFLDTSLDYLVAKLLAI